MIWIGLGGVLMLAAGTLLALRGWSPRHAAVSATLALAGAFVAMNFGSLLDFRPGAQVGVYHLLVGDILLFALVASYHGSRPPAR